jgi:acyl carrier protein
MGLDSIELLMEIENYFNIRVPDAEAEKIYTVQSMVDSVAAHLHISENSFTLRDDIFRKIADALPASSEIKSGILLSSSVEDYISFDNRALWKALEASIGLKVPAPDYKWAFSSNLNERLLKILHSRPKKEKEIITFEQLTAAICSCNYSKLIDRTNIKTLYEIYVVVAGITCDKIGEDIYNITPDKSFTNDLGVD